MALLVALGITFDKEVRTLFLAATGLVYYAVYSRDLHLIGYRWHQVFRVLALNLVLIPINVVGMIQSVVQAITGRKPQFTRTPKVENRTRVPAAYVLTEFALLAIWFEHSVYRLIWSGSVTGAFLLLHAVFLAYAIGSFMGYRNSFSDLGAALPSRQPRLAAARVQDRRRFERRSPPDWPGPRNEARMRVHWHHSLTGIERRLAHRRQAGRA
jgi:hypothetical protein